MDSRPDHLPRFAAPLAVAASAAGWWFASHLDPLWWAAWLAPLPLLWIAPRMRARSTALAVLLAWIVGGGSQWHYLHDVIRLPLPVVLMAIVLPALLMLPVVLLFRALTRRGRTLAAMLSVPLAATGLGWLAAASSPHGTFGNIAYSQMDALPVIQIAAVTGLWGVGFVVWLLPSMLAALGAPAARGRAVAFAAGVGILALALGYGVWRLHDDAPTQRVRVGLVSIDQAPGAEVDLDTPAGQRVLARYVDAFNQLAADGAQVVVAPESALLVHSHAIPELAALATQRRVRLLIGVEDHGDPRLKHNAALVFLPGSAAPAAYYKRHLIPGFEDRYTPGTADLVLDGVPPVGVAICKDLDFTATGRAQGLLGTQLLLVPAWDFDDDGWLHGRMAILRGVESGFAIARSARNGRLTLSDNRGRVLAEASTAGIGKIVTLLGDVPLQSIRTPYTRWGDAFGWLCALAATALALSLMRKSK